MESAIDAFFIMEALDFLSSAEESAREASARPDPLVDDGAMEASTMTESPEESLCGGPGGGWFPGDPALGFLLLMVSQPVLAAPVFSDAAMEKWPTDPSDGASECGATDPFVLAPIFPPSTMVKPSRIWRFSILQKLCVAGM